MRLLQALLLLLLPLVVLFLPVLATGGTEILSHPLADTRLQFVALRGFLSDELQAGRLPLWNPFALGGMPFLGGGISAVFYPLNLLLFGSFSLPTALNLVLAIQMLLAGVFMYWYLREIEVCRFESVIGAISFMLSTVFVHRVFAGHHSDVAVWCWAPALFALVERFFRTGSRLNILASSAVFAMMILAGHPQQQAFITVGVGIYAAGRACFAASAAMGVRACLEFLGVMILGGCALGAIQLLPLLEFAGLTNRVSLDETWAREFCALFSLPPENLLCFFAPGLLGDNVIQPYWGRWLHWEMCPYIGLTPWAFLPFAGTASRRRYLLPLLVLAMSALILALGAYLPTFALVKSCAVLQRFRGYSKFIGLVCFSVTALGAIGMSEFFGRENSRRCAWTWISVSIITVGCVATYLPTLDGVNQVPQVWRQLLSRFATIADKPDLFQTMTEEFIRNSYLGVLSACRQSLLILFLLTLVVLCRKHDLKISLCKGLLLFVVLGDLLWNAWGFFQFTFPYPIRGFGPEIREFLQKQPVPFRVATPLYLAQNDVVTERWESVSGYDTLVWAAYSEFINTAQGKRPREPVFSFERLTPSPLIDLLNVRYWIYPRAAATTPASLELRLKTADWILYENPRAFPRFYAVTSARELPDRTAVLKELPATDHRKIVLIEGKAESPKRLSATASVELRVKVIEWLPAKQTMEVELSAGAWVVFADANFPGWQATVDGNPVTIMTGNGLLRTLALEEGLHRVSFEFSPASVKRGAWISLASLLTALVWFFLAMYRRAATRDSPANRTGDQTVVGGDGG